MKSKFILAIVLTLSTIIAFGQRPTMELTFTAVDNTTWMQLDSIKVINHTQGGDTVLYWPDTDLILDYQAGISEEKNHFNNLNVFQNYPNPVKDQTIISLYVPARDEVDIVVTDVLGRVIIKMDRILKKGYHSFRFIPCDGSLFFFTAKWRGKSNSIKMLHDASQENPVSSLEYIGCELLSPQLKATGAMQSFSFSLGDDLVYIGYTGPWQSSILDAPDGNKSFTFQYATNIPCPGTTEVLYEGHVYHTVQIFSQCWLKENLNVGTRIDGILDQLDNDTIEKYCYDNDSSNCVTYGGLYQWDEMMNYTTMAGAQGICPPGWHIPTDEEWKLLEGAVDSQYGYPDPEWNGLDYRGFDVGERLKSQNSWSNNGNGSDLIGFSALATGCRRYTDGGFLSIGIYTSFWSSAQTNFYESWYRYLEYFENRTSRHSRLQSMGRSVRCIMDD
jgi:uncharacterized protein (TIGR02145 family)